MGEPSEKIKKMIKAGETTRVMFADPQLGESESRAIFIDPVTLKVKGDTVCPCMILLLVNIYVIECYCRLYCFLYHHRLIFSDNPVQNNDTSTAVIEQLQRMIHTLKQHASYRLRPY